jgi:hypothetical protein
VVCRYCGQAFQTAQPPPPPPRIIVIGPGTPRPTDSPTRSVASGVGRSLLSGAISLLVVGAIGYAQFRARTHGATAAPSLPSFPSLPAGLTAAISTFMWDSVAGPPIPAPIGSGEVEGFVGRVRTHGDDSLWIAGFEGTKLSEVWKAGPFGTYSQGYRSTYAAVVGRDLVVTDYRAMVHVYDVATGRESRTIKLTDRAKGLCASPDGKPHVWLEMSDEKNVLVDADAGTATAAARPAWCPQTWGASHDCRGWLTRGAPKPGCRGAESAPKVAGFQAANVMEDGDLAVALGEKHPGTALPTVVGFDPKTKAVRWQASVGSGDPAALAESTTTSLMDSLAGGRFVTPYEITSKGWRFTAFDARTGQRLWDVPLQPASGSGDSEGFSLSAARVYVMRSSTLEVYDAKTGAFVGTVGG